jgi:hypothetical protein
VQGDEYGRDVDRESTHPGDWPVVIGGSDSEHISIIAFGFMSARGRREGVMNSPRQRWIGRSGRDAKFEAALPPFFRDRPSVWPIHWKAVQADDTKVGGRMQPTAGKMPEFP